MAGRFTDPSLKPHSMNATADKLYPSTSILLSPHLLEHLTHRLEYSVVLVARGGRGVGEGADIAVFPVDPTENVPRLSKRTRGNLRQRTNA